jgi:hypothetical protein
VSDATKRAREALAVLQDESKVIDKQWMDAHIQMVRNHAAALDVVDAVEEFLLDLPFEVLNDATRAFSAAVLKKGKL